MQKDGKEMIEPPEFPELKNKTKNIGTLPMRQSDFQYLLALFEGELIKTPANREISKILGNVNEEIDQQQLVFDNYYKSPDFHSSFERFQLKPKILHTMLKITETEQIVEYEFIVIKPVGFQSSLGRFGDGNED